MKAYRRLTLEQLEDRTVPTAVTTPWPDAQHLTISFVPDGAYAANGASNLFSAMDAQNSTAAWQQTILQAFQTWAANSNINIGVVSDDGSPLGTPGALQGDQRFGDIRIAAQPLPSAAVATTGFVQSGNTWSGDMILNSNYSFGSGPGQYDLFSVVLHEAGHDFGLPDSADPNSVEYQGYRLYTGLSSGDIALLQSNYGARLPDAYQANGANSTRATAAQLQQASGANLLAPLTATADSTTNGQVEYFRFQTPSFLIGNSVDVRLHAQGLSLFTGQLTVYDANGNQVASGAATDPLNNDVLIHLANVQPGATYFVRVQSARADVFGVGAYQVSVNLYPQFTPGLAGALGAVQNLTAASGSPSTLLTANGIIAAANTQDVYRIQTQSGGNYSAGFNVTLQNWGVGVAAPTVSVYNAWGQLLANGTPTAGVFWAHVSGVVGGASYYVVVQSGARGSAGLGAYVLQADMHPISSSPPLTSTTLLMNSSGLSNNSIGKAVTLQNLAGFPTNAKYAVIGSLISASDTDFFRVKSLAAAVGQVNVLTVTVLAQNADALSPRVTIFDSHGAAVAGVVLTNANGVMVVQLVNAAPNTDYFIQVGTAARTGSVNAGNYFLTIDCSHSAAIPLQNIASDVLTQAASQQYRTLSIAQDQLVNFVLSANTAGTATPAAVQMTIYDASGALVFSLVAYSGQPASSGTVYLGAGNYTVRYAAAAQSGAALPSVSFAAAAQVLSQPIGPLPINPTGIPTSSPTSYTTTTTTTSMDTIVTTIATTTMLDPISSNTTTFTTTTTMDTSRHSDPLTGLTYTITTTTTLNTTTVTSTDPLTGLVTTTTTTSGTPPLTPMIALTPPLSAPPTSVLPTILPFFYY